MFNIHKTKHIYVKNLIFQKNVKIPKYNSKNTYNTTTYVVKP